MKKIFILFVIFLLFSCSPYIKYLSEKDDINTLKIITNLDKTIYSKSLDKDNCDLLFYSSKYNSVKILMYLFTKHININKLDKKGRNALHFAVENNSLETADLLIKNNIDINCSDEDGFTPIFYIK